MRPCFLVIDHEYPGSISTRKLVIETEKLNVITAYSAQDAIQALTRFPAVDGVVMDDRVEGLPCEELIKRLRAIRNDVPIILISPTGFETCGGEDHHVSSFDPKDLLAKLQKICGKEIQQVIRPDEKLAVEESKSPDS
jgi:CheY-like chemotaxis protein